MSILTKGRTELSCYNNIGGIKNVYLFKYVSYAYNQIVGGTTGELTSFPTTTIYKYEVKECSFNEKIQNDENGILYNQEARFVLTKQDLETTVRLNNLKNIDLRYIVEFNDGSFRICGLYKGAEITVLDLQSGGNKPEFNGYRVSLVSREDYKAPYITNLSDAGFSINGEDINYVFQDGNNYVFQDGNNFIFN